MPKTALIFLLGLFSIIIATRSSYAQDYKGAIGARFGYGIGISGIYMVDQSRGFGLEFLLRYGYHGLILNKPGGNAQVLFEKHWEIGRKGSWTAYLGGGPAIGMGKKVFGSKDLYFVLGISPIAGIDFTAQQLRIPLILAFDYKPTLNTDFPFRKNYDKKIGVTFSYYEIAFSVRVGLGR